MMDFRKYLLLVASFALFASVSVTSPARSAVAQDHPRGRKYKSPPDTSHIEVEVVRSSNGKPIPNAAVIFNPEKDGKDEGNLEVKTGPDGKATIDVIPKGSKVRVQVIAEGFATFADDYLLTEDSKEVHIKMLRPRAQVSTYQDNSGKASERKPGVQEPIRPGTGGQAKDSPLPADKSVPGATTTPVPDSTTPSPAPATKPNL